MARLMSLIVPALIKMTTIRTELATLVSYTLSSRSLMYPLIMLVCTRGHLIITAILISYPMNLLILAIG